MFVCPECGLGHTQAGHCPHDGTPLAASGDDALIGTTLGAYRVARLLGVGGMGRVYKGVHPQIGSRVAIKVLSHECAQRQDLVERFFAEARAVNLIRHESIVNVLDLATLPDGRPYIIMEYLDGAPLTAIVEQAGPLPVGSLARLVAEVLDALGAAHAKGIVHRDLKPDNIFVTPAGRPKVLDFGIAKLQQNHGLGGATQTGSLLGTPHYMSPEQAMGRAVDLRTDIYAIGIILYECVTGRRPFEATSLFDLLRRHVDEPPPPPRALRPDLPPLFEQVILRALEKNPDARWQSATALSQALQHATQGLPQGQWMPITPGTASAIAAQRTPMSWPSGSSWPGQPMPGPTASGGPMTPPHMFQHGPTHDYPMPPAPAPVSTATSGQAIPSRAPGGGGGGRGPWIALALAGVLGGGGAAVYFATRTSGGGSAAANRAGAPGGDDDEIADDEAAAPIAVADDRLEAELEQLDDTIEKAAESLDRNLSKLAGTPTGPAPTTARPPPTTTTPRPTTTTPKATATPPTKTPPAPATLDAPYPLPRPAGFDPKAFDVSGYYKTAEAAAKKVWPDAQLVRIDADGVRPDGKAELTLSDDFYVRYWFRSEKASERPADLPIGVEHETVCNLQVWVEPDGIKVLPMKGWDCDTLPAPKPKCTFEGAWKKAIELGAPSGNAVAQISYMKNIVSKQVRWFVTIGDAFSEQIPDGGC